MVFVHFDHTAVVAANMIAQSYERLLHQLREAKEYNIL